jgi:hypothetical protein
MKNHHHLFSDQELIYLNDRQFLLSKIEIGKKIESLLGEDEQNLYTSIPEYSWPAGVLVRSGKLSRGENYRGLPYYILDYPRRFDRENVFSLRTMFWWGNFFSTTLHLGGNYLEMSRSVIMDNIDQIRSSTVFACVNNNPWEYHYQPDNYQSAAILTQSQLGHIISSGSFLKLSFRWGLDQYMNIPVIVPEVFQKMLGWIVEPERN